MEWFKINIPVQDSEEILESLRAVLIYTKRANPHKVGCFTKVVNKVSIDVFLTEEVIRNLPGNLRLEYNLQKCAPPSQKSDKGGSTLTYQFGHSDLL